MDEKDAYCVEGIGRSACWEAESSTPCSGELGFWSGVVPIRTEPAFFASTSLATWAQGWIAGKVRLEPDRDHTQSGIGVLVLARRSGLVLCGLTDFVLWVGAHTWKADDCAPVVVLVWWWWIAWVWVFGVGQVRLKAIFVCPTCFGLWSGSSDQRVALRGSPCHHLPVVAQVFAVGIFLPTGVNLSGAAVLDHLSNDAAMMNPSGDRVTHGVQWVFGVSAGFVRIGWLRRIGLFQLRWTGWRKFAVRTVRIQGCRESMTFPWIMQHLSRCTVRAAGFACCLPVCAGERLVRELGGWRTNCWAVFLGCCASSNFFSEGRLSLGSSVSGWGGGCVVSAAPSRVAEILVDWTYCPVFCLPVQLLRFTLCLI